MTNLSTGLVISYPASCGSEGERRKCKDTSGRLCSRTAVSDFTLFPDVEPCYLGALGKYCSICFYGLCNQSGLNHAGRKRTSTQG